MTGGVRDTNKGISSYWKTIFKNQHFSSICFGGFFFSFKGRFLGMSYWGWVLNVLCLVLFIYIYIYMYTLSDQRSWAVSYFALIINKRYSIQLLTTQKPLNRPGWWKGKFALFQMPATAGECRHLSRGWLSPPPPHTLASSGARAFTDRRRGLNAKTAQSALTVIFKLVIGGLTNIVLAVLGTVNLQFQGPFAPIPLRPVLRNVVAHVMGTVWLSRS